MYIYIYWFQTGVFPCFCPPCLRHLQADAPTPPSDTGCPQRRGRRQLFRHGELLRRLGHPLGLLTEKWWIFGWRITRISVQMVFFNIFNMVIWCCYPLMDCLCVFFSFLYGVCSPWMGFVWFCCGIFGYGKYVRKSTCRYCRWGVSPLGAQLHLDPFWEVRPSWLVDSLIRVLV